MSIGVSMRTTKFATPNNGCGVERKEVRNPPLGVASNVSINGKTGPFGSKFNNMIFGD